MVQLYCGTVVLVLGGELKVVLLVGGSGGVGTCVLSGTPVVARVLGMSFRVFSCLGRVLGCSVLLPAQNPHKFPSYTFRSPPQLHLEQQHFWGKDIF